MCYSCITTNSIKCPGDVTHDSVTLISALLTLLIIITITDTYTLTGLLIDLR